MSRDHCLRASPLPFLKHQITVPQKLPLKLLTEPSVTARALDHSESSDKRRTNLWAVVRELDPEKDQLIAQKKLNIQIPKAPFYWLLPKKVNVSNTVMAL